MDLSINSYFFLIFKIDTQIHSQKIIIFLYFKYLFRNLQNTQILKKFKTQTQTKTFEYFWVQMSGIK